MTEFTGIRPGRGPFAPVHNDRLPYPRLVELANEAWDATSSLSGANEYLRDLSIPAKDRRRIQVIIKRDLVPTTDFSMRGRLGLSYVTRTAVASPDNPARGYPCVYCGAPATDMDHVWPRSRGGDDHPNNLVRSCGSCNHRKSTKSVLTDACSNCGGKREPGDVETSTGCAFYHCRCGHSWTREWDLQHPSI